MPYWRPSSQSVVPSSPSTVASAAPVSSLSGPIRGSEPRPRAVMSFERGVEDAPGDHRQRQRPHPRRAAVEQPLEAGRPGRAQHGGVMSVVAGVQDLKGVVHGPHRDAALQQKAEPADDFVGPLRQVGQGALPDLAALAVGLAEQHGGRGFPVGHSFDIHVFNRNGQAVSCQ